MKSDKLINESHKFNYVVFFCAQAIPCEYPQLTTRPSELLNYFSCSNIEQQWDELKKLSEQLSIPFTSQPILYEQYQQKESQLQLEIRKCQDQRFELCSKDYKPRISKSKLEHLFQSWVEDPKFRYTTGGGSCEMRANHLAYELGQLGYKANLIRIGSAPTLIAMEKNSEGSLNGNYYDYGGYHSLIQIIVKENGEDVPYLLDPQFMDRPIKREQYFIQTMGQNCLEEKDVSQKRVRSSLNCYYSIFEQNQMSESTPHANQVLKDPLYACGWYFDIEFLEGFSSKSSESPTNKTTLIIESLNSEVPNGLKGSTVNHNTSKQLILEAYRSHKGHILEKIQQAESQLSAAQAQLENTSPFYDADPEYEISFNTQLLAQLRKDLEGLEEKKREIRENLGI